MSDTLPLPEGPRSVHRPVIVKGLLMVLIVLGLSALCWTGWDRVAAQQKPAAAKFEYALLKWDGPDRIQIFYPDRFDYYRLFEKNPKPPKEAHDEEYCVNIVINNLAKDGWQPIQLHATRVLFQRAVGH